jgi:polysaccharide export outer membrane protein
MKNNSSDASILYLYCNLAAKKVSLYVQDLDNYANTSLVYASSKIQPNDILKVEISDLNC